MIRAATRPSRTLLLALTATLGAAAPVQAQHRHHGDLPARPPRHLIVPQTRAFAPDGTQDVTVARVDVDVRVLELVARTTIQVTVHNSGRRIAEGEVLLPVPAGAQVVGFDFEGAGAEPSARLLPADEARREYDAIVRKLKDPALLEFAGHGAVRSSVFPIPAGGDQHVKIVLEQLLDVDGDRVDYVLPRSESLALQVPWSFDLELRSKAPIATVYSPSHDLAVESRGPGRVHLATRGGATRDPGAFRFSYLLQRGEIAASMLAYPDSQGPGGWFLLLAGLAPDAGDATAPRREVTVVLDRSGSMAGEKFTQARVAALQVLEGLRVGEAFRLVDYSDSVNTFHAGATIKTTQSMSDARRYLAGLTTGGGTNLDGAIQEALRSTPPEGYLPLVLFLTDGLPTVGTTSELAIRENAAKANGFGRRVFPFGVGLDVNAPLLDALADQSRAASTYVLPGEDVEVAVGGVFRRLRGPILTDLSLEAREPGGDVTTRLLRDMYPRPLPDLFEGDRLVMLGRYSEAVPVELKLTGKRGNAKRSFRILADLSRASARNDFIPRLWAGRRIASLMDELRQAGADPTALANAATDPRWKELTDEVLALSTRFGVMSEYTAFLALEGTRLDRWQDLSTFANASLVERAGYDRSGAAGVNQGRNWNELRVQERLNYSNPYWAADNSRVTVGASVQQVADRAFFRRGARWVDGGLIRPDGGEAQTPDEVIVLGSPAHAALVRRLAAEGRAGLVALPGEVLLRDGGRTVLIQNSVQQPTQDSMPAPNTDPARIGSDF